MSSGNVKLCLHSDMALRRQFIRLLTKRAQIWTEMFPDATVLHAEEDTLNHMLESTPNEHPIVVQLGGNNIETLRRAAQVVVTYGYDEIDQPKRGMPLGKSVWEGSFWRGLNVRGDAGEGYN